MLEWLVRWLRGGSRPAPAAPVPAPPRPASTPDSRAGAPGQAPEQPRPDRPSPGQRGPLQLDAAQFTALPDAEVRRQTAALGGLEGSFGPFFGRRDLIPPTDDPRTLLVDRAMVAHGLLAPEELAEIHRVGEEMDAVRPDLALAHRTADQAVVLSKSEREQLKQRKKAEAAERRRRRAAEVAERRGRDIVYLGRGVSGGLCDRGSDLQKLEEAGLPPLGSPADVASALGIGVPRLRWLAFHSEAATRTHYVRFTVPKKSGGTRELAAPHRTLAACQRWILRDILDKLPPTDAAQGFVRGRSTVSNAAPHLGREVVLNADLKDFFPSITFRRVRGAFRRLGYSPAAASVLGLLCTESPRRTVTYAGKRFHVATGPRALPQGAPSSPALSNLIARRLDARLGGIARRLGWTYTRYADDLSFSADGEAAQKAGYLLARLRHITAEEGFTLNEKKTRVQRRNTAQTVTGIVVNEQGGVPRELRRRLRSILHEARGTGLEAQNREGRPHFEAWVRGMVAYVAMVQPDHGRPLQQALESLDRQP